MRKKIWILIISLILLCIILIALKSAGVIGKDEGVEVSTEKVEKRTIIETVNASGKIYPEIEVKVSPDISGEIVELMYEEGDSVRKGAPLVRIYADIYSTQRNQAAAVVSQSRAMLENTKAQLVSLKSALDLAKITYDRQKKLLDDKVISRSEFDQAENGLHNAQSNYDALLQRIKSDEASILSSQASLERADKDLSRTTVVAPMSGIISLMSVKKGERVVGASMMAGTEMMRIADMSAIELQVEVGENDIPKVSLGDSAVIEVDAYSNRKFKGIVTKIASTSMSASIATATTTTNDVSNYKVHIRMIPESYQDLLDPSKPKKFPFRPGMNASADIQTTVKNDVLSVPINAVTSRQKKNTDTTTVTDNANQKVDAQASKNEEVVFVVGADGVVKRKTVKVGIQDINYFELLSGLEVGEQIVSGPYSVVSKELEDGRKVKVVKKDELLKSK
ncbi:efflux RND transporter periplasmic adaptor subunit [Gynurincola endophyticus]|jgi:HlyD family secretion protein|uniref:efflux RND transporter periplasmic adaptor subunit n=1 Tax=Gynurincola endophyticus TaxID=2479004 RepID=UPI000F8CABAE|nr:efflux RND transporter periplasmic adaptor subunit [Gynurincola endophyticus]